MTYAPTKLDHTVHAHIRTHGPQTARQLQAAGLSTSREMLCKICKRLTNAGYLMRTGRANFGGFQMPSIWTAIDKPLPPWKSQTGPKGPRMPPDDPWQRSIDHRTGEIPGAVLARCYTLSGLMQQVINPPQGMNPKGPTK